MSQTTRNQLHFCSRSSFARSCSKLGLHFLSITLAAFLLLICAPKPSYGDPIEELGPVSPLTSEAGTPNVMRWDRTYGGFPGYEGEEPPYNALVVIQTADGGYVLGGQTLFKDAIWVMKVDKAGQKRWDREFDNMLSRTDRKGKAFFLIQARDGGFVVAGSKRPGDPMKSEYWVAKLDQKGSVEWEKTYHESDRNVTSFISELAEGGYLLAGDAYPRESDAPEFSIIKLTPKGDKEWLRHAGRATGNSASAKKPPDMNIPTAIMMTKSGEYILSGRTEPAHRPGQAVNMADLSEDFWLSKFDKTGTKVWEKYYPANIGQVSSKIYIDPSEIVQTSDGGYAVLRTIQQIRGDKKDRILLKAAPDGSKEWEYIFESSSTVLSLSHAADGGCILSGLRSGFNTWESVGWIMKLDKKGNKEWEETFRNKGSRKVISSVAQTDDGGFALAGQSDSRAWLIKLDRRNK